jgi:hypothetical protein
VIYLKFQLPLSMGGEIETKNCFVVKSKVSLVTDFDYASSACSACVMSAMCDVTVPLLQRETF